MTTRPLLTLVFVAPLAVLTACGSSTTTNVTAPTTVRCQPSISPSVTSFPATGGTATATVGVSRECEWSATSNAPWLVITGGARGQGDGTITYRVDPNADPVARRGALAAGGIEVELSQAAAPCRYDVGAGSTTLPADGGETRIDVSTHAACSWTASTDASWAGLTPTSGRGTASLRLSAGVNSGGTRSVTVAVSDGHVTVTQLARSQPAPVPPPPAPPPAPPDPGPVPPPAPGTPIDLDGKVESLSGACPALSFVVQARLVLTTAATEFKKVQCKDVKNGMSVKVSGTLMPDNTVVASRVEKD